MRYTSTRETYTEALGHQYHITTIPCPTCKQTAEITVFGPDLFRYNQGAYIQQAFPYLTPAERDRLLNGMCGPCFDALFADEG